MPFIFKEGMTYVCACCGDFCNAVYPCVFTFHDGLAIDLDICLDCMETGTLKINLQRKRMVAEILRRFNEKDKI